MSILFKSLKNLPKNNNVTGMLSQKCVNPTELLLLRLYSKKECDKKASGPAAPTGSKTFKIYRYDGTKSGGKPYVKTYTLDAASCGRMVLDALLKIKEMDPPLAYRKSCREGICGSCSINLQGYNCLACITAIPKDKVVKIYPIPHMYVIRDLVVDMTHFINGYNSVRPYLIRNDNKPLGSGQLAQSINDSLKMIGLYECILCACCSTACPSYWWNGRRFLGPASLLHAYRWVIDSRDEDTERRLKDLSDDFKLFKCHTIMTCSIACPRHLHPAREIARLKRLVSGLDKKKPSEMDVHKFSQSGSCLASMK